jgi:hypothetical protein
MNESKIFQLDFFLTPEESEMEALRKEVKAIGDSSTKVRKKLFCENGKLNKRLTDLEDRYQILERALCQKK